MNLRCSDLSWCMVSACAASRLFMSASKSLITLSCSS